MASYTESNNPVFESVNQLLKDTLSWQPITSTGTTNRLFSAQMAEQKLILRINAEENLAFGVSRESEAHILALIQIYPWAPKVVKNDWQEGWCLMHDHGASLAEEACQAISPLLLASINQWQKILPVEGSQIEYKSLFNAYQGSILNNFDGAAQAGNLSLLDQLIILFNELPQVPLCLTHHDLHLGNLCGNQTQLTVLDWEYAGFGNPWFDAACLRTQFDTPIATIGCLPAFRHLHLSKLKQGMTNAIELIKVLETLWFAVRPKHSVNTRRN